MEITVETVGGDMTIHAKGGKLRLAGDIRFVTVKEPPPKDRSMRVVLGVRGSMGRSFKRTEITCVGSKRKQAPFGGVVSLASAPGAALGRRRGHP